MFKVAEKMKKKEYLNLLADFITNNHNISFEEYFKIRENEFINTLCFLYEIKENETSAPPEYFNNEDLLFRFNKFIGDSKFDEKTDFINNDSTFDIEFDIEDLQPIEFFYKNDSFLHSLSTYELSILNLAFINKNKDMAFDVVLPPEILPDEYKNRLLSNFNKNIFLNLLNEFPVNNIKFYPLHKEPEIRTDLKPYIWIIDMLMFHSGLDLKNYQDHRVHFIYVYLNLLNFLNYNESQLSLIINEYQNFLNYFFEGLEKIPADKIQQRKNMLKEKLNSHKLAMKQPHDNELFYQIIEK
ncbi:MAG: hypothetical protein ACQESN_08185 [Thermotogota bacterium]